mgnify:CR=1 FL=1
MGNQQSRQVQPKTTRGHVTHDNIPPSNLSKYAFNVREDTEAMRYTYLIDWSQGGLKG